MRIGIVAGEASGDYLAAALVRALRRRLPHLEVEGIGGEELARAGCSILFPMEKLAVMGLVEVLGSYAGLVRLRRRLLRRFLESPPDLFIGVDSPDFNLGLEESLRRRGVRTVHYVSPSVWAWRRQRVRRIRRAVDLMLVLFPFEAGFYRDHRVPVAYVGHPLADSIPLATDRDGARQRLGMAAGGPLVAVMPGSRRAELARLLQPMLLAAHWCHRQRPDIAFVSSVLDDAAVERIGRERRRLQLDDLPLTVFRNRSRDVLEAADVVLVASGTAALEAMLWQKPMVVTYKVNPLTYILLRQLVHIDHVALPNILAGEELVPELLQADCRPERLGAAVMEWLDEPDRTASLGARFRALHRELACHADDTAAETLIARFNLQ